MFNWLKRLFIKEEKDPLREFLLGNPNYTLKLTPKGEYLVKLMAENPDMKIDEAQRICNAMFEV